MDTEGLQGILGLLENLLMKRNGPRKDSTPSSIGRMRWGLSLQDESPTPRCTKRGWAAPPRHKLIPFPIWKCSMPGFLMLLRPGEILRPQIVKSGDLAEPVVGDVELLPEEIAFQGGFGFPRKRQVVNNPVLSLPFNGYANPVLSVLPVKNGAARGAFCGFQGVAGLAYVSVRQFAGAVDLYCHA